jgi:hypothetical protein
MTRRHCPAPSSSASPPAGADGRRRCTLVLLLVGSLYSRNFLSPDYLLLQLQIASFLGIIATGAMLVILLGQHRPVGALGGDGGRR